MTQLKAPAGYGNGGGCRICLLVPAEGRRDLDRLLTDSTLWPKNLYDLVGKPAKMTPAARKWGQVQIGVAWAQENGFADLNRYDVQRHAKDHVTAIPDLGELWGSLPRNTGPMAMMRFYEKSLQLGVHALEALQKRIDNAAEGEEPLTLPQLFELAELGAKMAVSAAMLGSRDKSPLDPPSLTPGVDDGGGFLAGSAPAPSGRMGHSRVRVIEGSPRPVHDEGPKDREHYNGRADQEGGPRL